jgi:tRNA A-37 threonylcarbamoyl transferase component Bud32
LYAGRHACVKQTHREADPVTAFVSFIVMIALMILVTALFLFLNLRSRQSRIAEPREKPRRWAAISGIRPTAMRPCPECGKDLPAGAPEGLCPQCLLKGVISSAHDAARSAERPTAAYDGSSTAPTVEELAPLFPQLEILELIGQGGMGAVYKARQPALDRLVAVKVLPPQAGRDPSFAERFAREARALARLGHPNIVAVHDVGQAGDFYYFVMEYVDGANLRQVLRDGKLTPEQALRIVPQICDALQYAHEEGIVHRDIKPENILLDRKGRVKIADFGLAKLLGRDTGNFTLTGSQQVMGTLYYMAPEQVERPLEVDHRADIYSLGVVFYEMLTGQLPVGRYPMPSEKAGTDAFLDEVVLHALEREPARRYQHASDVKSDVEGANREQVTLDSQRVTATARAGAGPKNIRHGLARQLPGRIASLFRSGTIWAILCCVIGLSTGSFSFWATVTIQGRVNTEGKNFDRNAFLANWDRGSSGPGYLQVTRSTGFLGGETWQGLAVSAWFLLLGALLIATSSLRPVPIWRPLITLGTGLMILVLVASYLFLFDSWKKSRATDMLERSPQVASSSPAKEQGKFQAPEAAFEPPKVTVTDVSGEVCAAPFVTLSVALVLVLLGSLQLRGIFLRKPLPVTGTGWPGE